MDLIITLVNGLFGLAIAGGVIVAVMAIISLISYMRGTK